MIHLAVVVLTSTITGRSARVPGGGGFDTRGPTYLIQECRVRSDT